MDRRSFIGSCTAGAACLSAASFDALAGNAKPKAYARVLLVDEHGDALKASSLKPRTNYVFHYPFEATPVFRKGRRTSMNGVKLGRCIPVPCPTAEVGVTLDPGVAGVQR